MFCRGFRLDGEEACYYLKEGLYDLNPFRIGNAAQAGRNRGADRYAQKRKYDACHQCSPPWGALTDKITGLDCGADDYLVKPFDFEELAARIRSIGTRPRRMEISEKLTFADISFLKPEEARLTGPAGYLLPFQAGGRSYGNLSPEYRPVSFPPDSALPCLGGGQRCGGGESG